MIIVSQDKTKTTARFEFYIQRDEELKFEIRLVGCGSFGTYETEERAKEILQQITIAYANITMLGMPKINIHEFIPAKEIARNIVYQMPEK